jgi:hypothetical protein
MRARSAWAHFRHARVIDPDAAERGRLMAAHRIASDPAARARVEKELGVEVCRANWPEAYRSQFFKLIDKVRDAIPWGYT